MVKKKSKKILYKVKNIKSFLGNYADPPFYGDGDPEPYYSISSYDAILDPKNIDYIGFWYGDTYGKGLPPDTPALSLNNNFNAAFKKNKKRRNNIITFTPLRFNTFGSDVKNPSISKIYYKNKLTKFYFNYTDTNTSIAFINKVIELKKKKIVQKFTVKNNKITIFSLEYLRKELVRSFYHYYITKILRDVDGYSIKTIKNHEWSMDDFNRASEDLKKLKITFNKKNIIKLSNKIKKELLFDISSEIFEDYIYRVPNGQYVVSTITRDDINVKKYPSGSFGELMGSKVLGCLVELKK